MRMLVALLLSGCGTPAPDAHRGRPAEPEPDSSAQDTGALDPDRIFPGPAFGWVSIGDCEVRMSGPPALPTPVAASCVPAPPGWASGPVGDWALATVRGQNTGDTMGYDLASVDPDGDGKDALVVGVPRRDIGTYYFAGAYEAPHGWPRVYLLSDLVGVVEPTTADALAWEHNTEPSIGESVGALTPAGPVLVGDYWDPGPGLVRVIDVGVEPYSVTEVEGGETELCGIDVAAADVDASGTTDLVAGCLGDLFYNPGLLRTFERDETTGAWAPLGWLEGTARYAWFGRPTVGGFDLDGDGASELAFGEEHAGAELESIVHLVSKPWRGHCTLGDVEAVELWTDFLPARLATGDLDGDGVAELVLAEPGQPAWSLNQVADAGAALAIRDPVSRDGPARDASWLAVDGPGPEEAFGTSVAIGDFNGDGCQDLAVGAPGSLLTSGPAGRVYVFDGPFEPGTLAAAEADVVLEGTSPEDFFGSGLMVGDFDGDGVDDLAVAAQFDSTVAEEAGAVYVLAGVRTSP